MSYSEVDIQIHAAEAAREAARQRSAVAAAFGAAADALKQSLNSRKWPLAEAAKAMAFLRRGHDHATREECEHWRRKAWAMLRRRTRRTKGMVERADAWRQQWWMAKKGIAPPPRRA